MVSILQFSMFPYSMLTPSIFQSSNSSIKQDVCTVFLNFRSLKFLKHLSASWFVTKEIDYSDDGVPWTYKGWKPLRRIMQELQLSNWKLFVAKTHKVFLPEIEINGPSSVSVWLLVVVILRYF